MIPIIISMLGDVMQYIDTYESPLGKITIAADEKGLQGLWFAGQNYYGSTLENSYVLEENEVLSLTKQWLDIYFAGKEPDFMPPLNLIGTSFQKEIWELLCEIPYGKTVTYGELAVKAAERRNIERMSAQAVGGAVGHNPISIIVPCHRVVGTNGSLTGYAGGIDKKEKLLKLERGT